jgi:NAD(P)-dependent dehydrogenase (short-subunit alcohol dehydrogenase family)
VEGPEAAWREAWDRTQAVNLRAPALLGRAALAHFAERGGGRIINIASRAAFRGDTPEYMAYAASKAGLVALTRSIARGYGKLNVKAFLVAPGFVRTEMAQQFFDAYGEAFALDDIALPALTEPEDLVPFVVLLASGLADHATGGTFDINAGSYVH